MHAFSRSLSEGRIARKGGDLTVPTVPTVPRLGFFRVWAGRLRDGWGRLPSPTVPSFLWKRCGRGRSGRLGRLIPRTFYDDGSSPRSSSSAIERDLHINHAEQWRQTVEHAGHSPGALGPAIRL